MAHYLSRMGMAYTLTIVSYAKEIFQKKMPQIFKTVKELHMFMVLRTEKSIVVFGICCLGIKRRLRLLGFRFELDGYL